MNLFGLRFTRNEARKILEKFGENSERNSGQNPGEKIEKFGELSFCDFSDLTLYAALRPRDCPKGKLGLSLGQTGLPLCKIGGKPGFVPATSPLCPRHKPGLSRGHSRGRPKSNRTKQFMFMSGTKKRGVLEGGF